MTNHANHPQQCNQPEANGMDREKARKLFERSLHLDIFNVGSVLDSTANE